MEYTIELKKNIDSKKIELVEPITTLGIGLLVFLGLTLIPSIFILLSNWEFWVKVSVIVGLALIFFFGFYWNNLIHIDEVYLGVPKMFGKRQSKWLFEEGYHWILPKPFMDFHPIYIGPQNLQIGHQVTSRNEIVQVNVDATVYWQVIDPFKMSTAQRITNELDKTGFINVIQGKLRIYAVENTQDTISLITVGDQYGEDVSRMINKVIKSSIQDWGIQILDVVMTKIVAINQETMNKFERILHENLEKQYELIDATTLADRIKIFIENAGVTGDVAADFVLGLRGVQQRKESKYILNMSPEVSNKLQEALNLLLIWFSGGNKGDTK